MPNSVSWFDLITIKMKVINKSKICLFFLRLDFVSFTTAQPTVGTCTDTFQVSGSTTVVPVICGDNAGQHSKLSRCNSFGREMQFCRLFSVYLDVPSSAVTATDVQLMFNFGTSTSTRLWNIKIAMLPCGASYLGKIFST